MALRLVPLFLLLSVHAFAQQGIIAGSVVDAATQQPLGGARVTATSPNLQVEQVAVTDASGQFRMPQLPPGPYTLRFEKVPLQPYTRSGIQLRADRTIRVTAQLLPHGVIEAVAIGTHPTIEVHGGFAFMGSGSELLRRVLVVRPTPRTIPVRPFESLAHLAPSSLEVIYAESIGRDPALDCFVIDGVAELAPEWTHDYPPVLTPTGEPHRLHIYPEELP